MKTIIRDDTVHGESYVTLADAIEHAAAEVAKEREQWQTLLVHVAAIAHNGGWHGMSEAEALAAVRKLTLSHLQRHDSMDKQRLAVIDAAKRANGA